MWTQFSNQQCWGAGAVIVSLLGYVVYFKSIARGETRPHMFSWIIWAIVSAVGMAGQYSKGAGPGSWTLGVTTLICIAVAIMAIWRGTRNITKSDGGFFVAGLMTIPLWIVTHDPLWSMILITVIDVFAFYPTYRKSWWQPNEESVVFYMLAIVKYGMTLLALENVNLTTALIPIFTVLCNGGLVAVLLLRRSFLNSHSKRS